MKILLTGAHGFIGSHVLQALSGDHEVIAPRSAELDLTNESAVSDFFIKHSFDYIIHLASIGVRIQSDSLVDEVVQANVRMFDNLSRYVGEACPMIVAGSGAEYDKSRPISKIREDDFSQRVPHDSYGYSKYLIAKRIEQMDHVLSLRLFGVYGVNENPTRVPTYVTQCNLNGVDIVLNQNVIFDYLYIDDLCKIIVYFLHHRTHERFINITPTQSIDIKSLAEMVNRISAQQSPIVVRQEGYANEYTADNSRLLSIMKNFEFTPYVIGMSKLYDALRVKQGS